MKNVMREINRRSYLGRIGSLGIVGGIGNQIGFSRRARAGHSPENDWSTLKTRDDFGFNDYHAEFSTYLSYLGAVYDSGHWEYEFRVEGCGNLRTANSGNPVDGIQNQKLTIEERYNKSAQSIWFTYDPDYFGIWPNDAESASYEETAHWITDMVLGQFSDAYQFGKSAYELYDAMTYDTDKIDNGSSEMISFERDYSWASESDITHFAGFEIRVDDGEVTTFGMMNEMTAASYVLNNDWTFHCDAPDDPYASDPYWLSSSSSDNKQANQSRVRRFPIKTGSGKKVTIERIPPEKADDYLGTHAQNKTIQKKIENDELIYYEPGQTVSII